MTKQTEALRLALEALERGETELRWKALTALREAREEQATEDNLDATIIQYHEATIKRLEARIAEIGQPTQHQCKFPMCHNEEYQQALAGQIERELVGEQPAQQEPVAWALSHSRGLEFSSKYPMQKYRELAEQMACQYLGKVTVTPLYTSPPAQRKPLTDEEIEEIAAITLFPIEFARAIEVAHSIKENT